MSDFALGPCRWDGLAPVQLRRYAPDGIPAWEKYSTVGSLNGSNPNIVNILRYRDFEPSSGIQIELLCERNTRPWKELGLQFATRLDLQELNFQEVLKQSLALIHRVQPLFGTVIGLCRSIHVLISHDVNFDCSYSDPRLPFSIFVSCPPSIEANRIERMAECIAHEALHLQLTLVEAVTPVVINTPSTTHLFSPWKNELRTVRGLVHGVYVFGNLRHFWNCIAMQFKECSSFAEARIKEIDIELRSAKDLVVNQDLTPMGQRLVASHIEMS